MKKESNMSRIELIALIVAIVALIISIKSLEYTATGLEWTEREGTITVENTDYILNISGREIIGYCNDPHFKCAISPDGIDEYKVYKYIPFFSLNNKGNRTLSEVDIDTRCTKCNFTAIIMVKSSPIEKNAEIVLPQSFYLYVERMPPIDSFVSKVGVVYEEIDKDDKWWIQYSSYENKKRNIVDIK